MASAKRPLQKSKPLRVGLTGGIGSGKSLVAKIFEVLKAPVFYADQAAKEILASDGEVVAKVKKVFGEAAYINGLPDKVFLAKKVFEDDAKREKLNAIIHPAVRAAFDRFCEKHVSAPYVLQEAAILVETGGHKVLDHLILVSAPQELRISRVMDRDNTDRTSIEKRMAAQLSDDEKRPYADFEIVNDDKNPVIPKVLQIHEAIRHSA